MIVVTNINVPSDVYRLYLSAAEHLGTRTAEQLMAAVLETYAEMVAEAIVCGNFPVH